MKPLSRLARKLWITLSMATGSNSQPPAAEADAKSAVA
jgi:hypothetical protein